MATLASRVSDLAAAVRTKINLMMPRLMPSGGGTGQVLTKASGANYSVGWVSPSVQVKGVVFFCSGKPNDGEMIGGGIAPYDFTINTAHCAFRSEIETTAATTISIEKNGTLIGTISFSAGDNTASSVVFTDLTVNTLDVITFHAANPADATFGDIMGLVRE